MLEATATIIVLHFKLKALTFPWHRYILSLNIDTDALNSLSDFYNHFLLKVEGYIFKTSFFKLDFQLQFFQFLSVSLLRNFNSNFCTDYQCLCPLLPLNLSRIKKKNAVC